MNKKIILLPLILVLFSLAVNAQNSCSDTDDGKIYDIPGTISGVVIRYTNIAFQYSYNDICLDSNILREYYCLASPDPVTGEPYSYEDFTCPTGETCENRACIECIPKTCDDVPERCGTMSDGCGGFFSCGSENCPPSHPECYNSQCSVRCGIMDHCQTGYECQDGVCIITRTTGGIKLVSLDCISDQICTENADCPSDYLCDSEGYCKLDCSTYESTNCPGECCKWDSRTGCLFDESKALYYCYQTGALHPLEECDPPYYWDNSGNRIDDPDLQCKNLGLGFTQGTFTCDNCIIDKSGCSESDICSSATEESDCSFYNNYISSCNLNEGSVCSVSIEDQGCYIISDNEDGTGECGDCANIGLCSNYPNSNSCDNNLCGLQIVTCLWDELSDPDPCTEHYIYTDENNIEWDCQDANWTACDASGYRHTEGTCSLTDGTGEPQQVSVPCRVTKEFPFFSSKGIIVILALLIGYYLFVNYTDKKKSKRK